MATAYYSSPDCLEHVNPPGHPEQVARLEYIDRALADSGFDGLDRREAPLADDADILLCHPQDYLDLVRAAAPKKRWSKLDEDTSMSAGSLRAAYRAVGGNIAAVDAVLDRQAGNAFVGCRPPGHHAETATAMGFCLFGNVSIAAKHALERRGLHRVAIVDFDVHHGNGTQDLLWSEERSFFVSSHQIPLYPGSGLASERGAFGNVLNVPLSPHTDGVAMRAKYDEVVFPALQRFKPQLILVSAGFDAHKDDPLAQLEWDESDFAWLTHRTCDVADEHCDGRVVSTLEGGYDLDALGRSVAAHVSVLMERSG